MCHGCFNQQNIFRRYHIRRRSRAVCSAFDRNVTGLHERDAKIEAGTSLDACAEGRKMVVLSMNQGSGWSIPWDEKLWS